MIRSVDIRPGQNIFDILLQEYGTLEAFSTLVSENPGLDWTDIEGQKIVIKSPVENKVIADRMKLITPTSA